MLTDDERSMIHRAADALGDEAQRYDLGTRRAKLYQHVDKLRAIAEHHSHVDESTHVREVKAAIAEWSRLRALSHLTGGPEAERAAYDRLCATITHAATAAEQRGREVAFAEAEASLRTAGAHMPQGVSQAVDAFSSMFDADGDLDFVLMRIALAEQLSHAIADAGRRGHDAGRAAALATAPEVETELDSLSVEFAISTDCYDPLKAAIAAHTAREVEQVRAVLIPQVATVGVLLTTAPAGAIAEWCDELTWRQVRDGSIRLRNRNNTPAADGWPGPEWSEWCPTTGYLIDDLRLPARLVSVDQADAGPSTRGPIGEG